MRLLFVCITVITFAGITELPAEPGTLSLSQAVEIAKANSLSLYAAGNNMKAAKIESRNRFNALYPEVTAIAGLTRSNESSSGVIPINPVGGGVYTDVMAYEIDPTTFNAGITGSLTLNPAISDGFKFLKLSYESAGLDVEEAEKGLERDVKVNFYNLIYMEGLIELTRESMETLEGVYEVVLSDYRNGRVSEMELLNTQVAYKNIEPVLARLDSSYREIRARFFLLLGVEDEGPSLDGTIDLPFETVTIPIHTPNLNEHFKVAAMDNTIAQTEIQRESTRHQSFIPSLTLSASYMPVVNDPFNDATWEDGFGLPWSDSGSIDITFSIPVDNWLPGSAARTSLKKQKITIDTLREQREQTLREVTAEVEVLYDNLSDSLLNIESLELSLAVAVRNYELTEDGYHKGIREFMGLKEAEDELNSAKQSILAEKLEFLTNLFDLEYALNSEARRILTGEKL